MTTVIVNLAALALIGLVVWWFWIATPRSQAATGQVVDITVDAGVYSPSRIEVPVGKPVTLRFLRRDPNPCAEKVIFADEGLSADLPVGKPVEMTFTPKQAGEMTFTCQMQMYRGTLVVVDRAPV